MSDKSTEFEMKYLSDYQNNPCLERGEIFSTGALECNECFVIYQKGSDSGLPDIPNGSAFITPLHDKVFLNPGDIACKVINNSKYIRIREDNNGNKR